MISFDHLLLTKRDPKETARFISWLKAPAANGAGQVRHMQVLHEHDDRCCRREAWPRTVARLMLEDCLWLFPGMHPAELTPDRN